jgi:hypothetical protein
MTCFDELMNEYNAACLARPEDSIPELDRENQEASIKMQLESM